MPFTQLKLEFDYDSDGNFLEDFFIPVLSEARTYDRAAGFFSSTVLVDLTKGLYAFAKHGGQIRVVASPYLTEDDFRSIQSGYDKRKVVEQALSRSLADIELIFDEGSRNRLNFLAKLIEIGMMDIRIAFRCEAQYHEKIGHLTDAAGNSIAFTGSLNETHQAYARNYESIDVFCSWRGDDSSERVRRKSAQFEEIWQGRKPGLEVFTPDSIKEEIIRKYLRNRADETDQDAIDAGRTAKSAPPGQVQPSFLPEGIRLRLYQLEAVDSFVNHGGRGIFDMATGTGKTFTAISAICALRDKLQTPLGVVVSVPLAYLVVQWAGDLRTFGIEPVLAFGGNKDWRSQLLKGFLRLVRHRAEKGFFCVVTTNQTFEGKSFQQCFDKCSAPMLLVADEAHNFGAAGKQKLLNDRFRYRLALSATFDRHRDAAGTRVLHDYFGEVCISYGLRQAIANGHLTPYEYHAVPVAMTEGERAAYRGLTQEIGRCRVSDGFGGSKLSPHGEMLLMERARLVATISGKIEALRTSILPYRQENGILVYCGTSGTSSGYDELLEPVPAGEEELRQIDRATRMLRQEGIRALQYTSEIAPDERRRLVAELGDGSTQALVAIKCLDEGVNIPSIRYAFILASTTNPKEYIQRRGRVLRLWDGGPTGRPKDKAVIFDFVTVPYATGEREGRLKANRDVFRQLAANELQRVREFNRLALNQSDNTDFYCEYCTQYDLSLIHI